MSRKSDSFIVTVDNTGEYNVVDSLERALSVPSDKLTDDVKKYLENYKSLGNCFRNYSRLYSSTTENISGFLRRYDLKDKKVLTVAGSGDQRLNALLFGAKQVTCFDINPLSELQLKLKDAVIKKVELDDYLHFFGVQEDPYVRDYELLNNKVFNQVKDNLDENTFDFFNYVINQSIYTQPKDIYFNIVYYIEK